MKQDFQTEKTTDILIILVQTPKPQDITMLYKTERIKEPKKIQIMLVQSSVQSELDLSDSWLLSAPLGEVPRVMNQQINP